VCGFVRTHIYIYIYIYRMQFYVLPWIMQITAFLFAYDYF